MVLGAGDQQLGLFVHVHALDGFSVSLERLYPGVAHGVPELRVSVLGHDHHVLRRRRRGYVTDRYAAADACNNERTCTVRAQVGDGVRLFVLPRKRQGELHFMCRGSGGCSQLVCGTNSGSVKPSHHDTEHLMIRCMSLLLSVCGRKSKRVS